MLIFLRYYQLHLAVRKLLKFGVLKKCSIIGIDKVYQDLFQGMSKTNIDT